TTLNAGGSCQVFVTFTPTASGTRTDRKASSTERVDIPRAVAPTDSNVASNGGSVTVTPASLNFGSQTVVSSSPTQTVTLINGASGSVTVNGIATSGVYSQQNNSGMVPFSTTLNAGGSCQVFVTFTPTASGTR